jgi:hypothetical protein
MEHSEINLEESSAFRASSKGARSEDPCGATEQDPVEQGASGTPLIEEERPPSIKKNIKGSLFRGSGRGK